MLIIANYLLIFDQSKSTSQSCLHKLVRSLWEEWPPGCLTLELFCDYLSAIVVLSILISALDD